MTNETAVNLICALLGGFTLLEAGEMEDEVSTEAHLVCKDQDGEVLYRASTIQILWALRSAGIEP